MFNRFVSLILPYLPEKFVWQFSRQYIAGETLEDAVRAAKSLNSQGMMTTIDVLGEFITTLEEAEENKHEYLQVIEACETAGVDGNYSLKPTFFGLLLDRDVAYRHIREVVAKAAYHDNFIRLDMEDSACTTYEIDLYKKLYQEFPRHVGLVVQAYLKRTLHDINELAELETGQAPVNLRLCKGIYIEPEEIAFTRYAEINDNFLRDLELMLQRGLYPAIATHDRNIIEKSFLLLDQYGLQKKDYEFQMLYGVTPGLRQEVLNAGHRMRVYVPFGRKWFGYSTRRLKENPKMVSMVLKALFLKG